MNSLPEQSAHHIGNLAAELADKLAELDTIRRGPDHHHANEQQKMANLRVGVERRIGHIRNELDSIIQDLDAVHTDYCGLRSPAVPRRDDNANQPAKTAKEEAP